MATLLGLTNPVPGHDNVISNRPVPTSPSNANNNPNIQNVPDTTRVVRADQRSEQQDAGNLTESARFRYESNFQTFLQKLQGAPDLVAELGRVLSGKQGTVVSSGLEEGLAGELSQIMEMLQMDQSQMKSFLEGQYKAGTRFGGALFAMLRTAYNTSQSEGMRQDILQFLKHYSDYSSTSHVEGNILRSLGGMAESIPASWGERLKEMTEMLARCMESGNRSAGLKLLQGQILPLISSYVERTHDMGRARGILTLLTLDIARYENGSEEALTDSFHRLRGYAGLKDKLGAVDDEALKWLLNNSEFSKAAQENRFADRLSAAAGRALRGSDGVEAQNAFREIVSAMLVNESVYMPLNHFVLPVQWDDRMMFSEMWVDPDEGGGSADGERTQRFLLKMDIQRLGLFDVVLASRGEYVELQIFCPEKVAGFAKTFEGALSRILTENGLKPGLVRVAKMERPLTITEVFPKIFEGMNSINVKV